MLEEARRCQNLSSCNKLVAIFTRFLVVLVGFAKCTNIQILEFSESFFFYSVTLRGATGQAWEPPIRSQGPKSPQTSSSLIFLQGVIKVRGGKGVFKLLNYFDHIALFNHQSHSVSKVVEVSLIVSPPPHLL